MKKFSFLILVLFVIASAKAQIVGASYDSKNMKHGFYNAQNQWVVKPQYAFAYWDKERKIGTFRMEDNGPEGLIDETGKIIFPIGTYKKYYKLKDSPYVELTDMSGKKGLGTMNGQVIVPCNYKAINTSSIKDGSIVKVQGGNELYGAYTLDGKELLKCEWKDIKLHYKFKSNGFIEVSNSQGRGIIHKNGTIIIPCSLTYEDINVSYRCIYVYKNNKQKQGVHSLDGKLLVECKYDEANCLDNYILVKNNGKEGAYSLDGTLITECKYDVVHYAGEGIAKVYIGKHDGRFEFMGGKWGYCANGKEIIPCIYDEATEFKNNVATVKKDGEVKLIKNPLKDGSQIQIAENSSPSNKKKVGGPAVSRYPAPDSDVDKDIPTAKKQAENTFAFIIANENYADAPVPYSLNDGRMFKEYCQKTLGLPEKNINLYEDATFGIIISAVEKMKSIADAYDGEANVIFYYAGHGFPDEKQNSAYLLPIDGDASSITTTGYSLAKLYKEISQLKLKSSILFLDACFSGAKREDQMLAQSRGVAIKVKSDVPEGKMLVFSAAQGDETAHQMEDKHHGLFTYYLLKGIQSMGSDVEMGALTEYVTKQVKRQSVVINNKKQTPTVVPSQALTNTWQTLKLK